MPQEHTSASWQQKRGGPLDRADWRKPLLVGTSLLIATVVALIIWLLWPSPGTLPVKFVGLGQTDYKDGQFNTGAEQDIDALSSLFSELAVHSDKVTQPVRVEKTQSTDEVLTELTRSTQNELLLIYCSLVARHGSEKLVLRLHENAEISFDELLSALGQAKKRAILLLDLAKCDPTWDTRRLLRNNVDRAVAELKNSELKTLTLLVATSGSEKSWALPVQDGTPIGSVFGNAILRAFEGEADLDGDKLLLLSELKEFVAAECKPWNQTVQLVGQRADIPLAPTGALPQPGDEDEAAETATEADPEDGDPTRPEDLEDKLWSLWQQRDRLWLVQKGGFVDRSGDRETQTPAEWAELNGLLVRAETAIRYGLHFYRPEDSRANGERILELLSDAEKLLKNKDPLEKPLRQNDFVSLGWFPQYSDGSVTVLPDTLPSAELSEKIKAAIAGVKEQPLGAIPELVKAFGNGEQCAAFVSDLLGQLAVDDLEEFEIQLQQVNTIIEALPITARWREDAWPDEFLTLTRLAQVAESIGSDRESIRILQQYFNVWRKANHLDGLTANINLEPEYFRLAGQKLEDGLEALTAAERWLLVGVAEEAEKWVELADKNFDDASKQVSDVAGLVRAKAILESELADSAESTAHRLDFHKRPFEARESPEVLELLLDDLVELDQMISEDKESSIRRALLTKAANHFKSFQSSMVDYAEKVASDKSRWPEIDMQLRNPWLPWETRKRLLENYTSRSNSNATKWPVESTGQWSLYWATRIHQPQTASQQVFATVESTAIDTATLPDVTTRKVASRVSAEKVKVLEDYRDLLRRYWSTRESNKDVSFKDLLRRSDSAKSPMEELTRITELTSEIIGSGEFEDCRVECKQISQNLKYLVVGSGISTDSPLSPVRSSQTLRVAAAETSPVAIVGIARERDSFPHHLKQVLVAAEFPLAGWKIEFQRENGRQLAQRQDRSDGTTQLFLQSLSGERIKLRLQRPPSYLAETVQVEVIEVRKSIDSREQRRPTGFRGLVKFEPTAGSAEFSLTETGRVSTFDVSGGICFRIADPRNPARFTDLVLAPTIDIAGQIRDPLCPLSAVRDGIRTLQVTLQRRQGSALKEVEVEVTLGQALAKLTSGPASQKGKLFEDRSAKFSFELLDVDSMREDAEFSIAVAGFPLIWHGKISDGQATVRRASEPLVRFIQTAAADDKQSPELRLGLSGDWDAGGVDLQLSLPGRGGEVWSDVNSGIAKSLVTIGKDSIQFDSTPKVYRFPLSDLGLGKGLHNFEARLSRESEVMAADTFSYAIGTPGVEFQHPKDPKDLRKPNGDIHLIVDIDLPLVDLDQIRWRVYQGARRIPLPNGVKGIVTPGENVTDLKGFEFDWEKRHQPPPGQYELELEVTSKSGLVGRNSPRFFITVK